MLWPCTPGSRAGADTVDAVRAEVEPATAPIGSTSPVMLVYGGPDLVGLAWWWEPPGPERPQQRGRSSG